MEAKRTLLALAIALAAFLLWMHVISRLPVIDRWLSGPPRPAKPPADQVEPPAEPEPEPERPSGPPESQPDSQPDTQPATQPTMQPTVSARPDGPKGITVKSPDTPPPPDAELVLGSLDRPDGKQSYYRMRVTLMPRGAGVRRAELTDFAQTTEPDSPRYAAIRLPEGREDGPGEMATVQVKVMGQTVKLDDKQWRFAGREDLEKGGQAALFVAELVQDGRTVLEIRKRFVLLPDRYDLGVEYRLVNFTSKDLEVSLSDAGVTALDREGRRDDDRELAWAVRPKMELSRKGRKEVIEKAGDVKMPGTAGDGGLAWAAVENRFFVVVLRPDDPRACEIQFAADPLGDDAEKSLFRLRWTGEKIVVPAAADPAEGADWAMSFSHFIGPKDRSLFTENRTYRNLNYEALINYGSCTTICMTRQLAPLMIWLLKALYAGVRNYGVAIMVLVVVVRLLLHPLTKKSQIAMSKMAKLQPKIEELKKQYGDNKQELNRAMAEFYRQEGFSPLLGCLPMLLQMPIWIALWAGLNVSIELRHAPFVGWINDLAAPDELIRWTNPANGYVLCLLGGMVGPIYSLNLLPILLMVAMFLQQLTTPKSASGPQASQQKFMMYFMTIFFGLLFYGMPSGLTLYVMASTAVGAGEQYVIKKHIKRQEEAEAAGQAASGRRGAGPPRPGGPPRQKRRR